MGLNEATHEPGHATLRVPRYLRVIGDNIRAARKRAGWTQEKLAERLDLSTNFIAHLERGSRKPSLETLVSMSRVLSVSLHEIVCPAGAPGGEAPGASSMPTRLLRSVRHMSGTALALLVRFLELIPWPGKSRGSRSR